MSTKGNKAQEWNEKIEYNREPRKEIERKKQARACRHTENEGLRRRKRREEEQRSGKRFKDISPSAFRLGKDVVAGEPV